jgi:hypothetical protein
MLIQPGALPTVPRHAVVPEQVVMMVLRRLTEREAIQPTLAAVFRRLETQQPALAEFVASELAELEEPQAQALAYFLFLAVFMAFRDAFGARLCTIVREDLESVLDRLVLDGEVRCRACPAESYSEDAVAIGQPSLMRLVRAELGADPALSCSDTVLQGLLIEIVALTAAVAPAS